MSMPPLKEASTTKTLEPGERICSVTHQTQFFQNCTPLLKHKNWFIVHAESYFSAGCPIALCICPDRAGIDGGLSGLPIFPAALTTAGGLSVRILLQ